MCRGAIGVESVLSTSFFGKWLDAGQMCGVRAGNGATWSKLGAGKQSHLAILLAARWEWHLLAFSTAVQYSHYPSPSLILIANAMYAAIMIPKKLVATQKQ